LCVTAKLARQMTLWVNRFTWTGRGRPRNVRLCSNTGHVDALQQNAALCYDPT